MPNPPAFLVDADAVIHLHSLGLVDVLCQSLQAGKLALHCTRYVWEQELSALSATRASLVQAGLQVHTVAPNSAAGETFKKMMRDRGNPGRNSKGENQLVAFARHAGFPITLVARDDGARRLAGSRGVRALDLAEWLCELVCRGALQEEVVQEHLRPWDNPYAGNGRPKDFDGFDSLLEKWRAREGIEA